VGEVFKFVENWTPSALGVQAKGNIKMLIFVLNQGRNVLIWRGEKRFREKIRRLFAR